MKDLSERLAGLSPDKRALLERVRARSGGSPDAAAPAAPAAPRASGAQPPSEPGQPAAEPIAVIGMGCRFPGGADSPEAYWRLLREGVDATVPVPPDRWDAARLHDPDPERPGRIYARRGGFLTEPVDRFDAAFFGISPREAESLDPQQRLLLEVSWEALEHAGQAPGTLAGSRTGVFVGIGIDDYKSLQTADEEAIDAYTGTGNLFCAAAGRISHTLGLTGPSMAVDTGCSSSLVAVHLAVRSLRLGESDMALACGVHLMLTPEITLFLSRARALSPQGRCRTFDADADGYARGEGCGAVVLKRLSDAVAAGDEVLAVIRGSAVNHDGPSAGLTVPNGASQQALLRAALADAGTEPAEVGYLEAHGTGTPLGDPIEVRAFGAVLATGRPAGEPLVAGSVKTNIGHLEAAAGIASLIKVVLALRHGEIPAHLHFQRPSPHIPWAQLAVRVPVERTPWPRGERSRVAGISSFGIGGTNAHVVVAEAPPAQRPEETGADRRPRLLPLSARDPQALRALAARYADRLAQDGLPWAGVTHTAARGRGHFAHRLAVVASDGAEAAQLLSAWAAHQDPARVAAGRAERGAGPRVAFLFTGQGSQYVGMGRGLYRDQPVFRDAVDRCAAWLGPVLERPLTEVMFGTGGAGDAALLQDTAYAQPAVFAVQYGLLELWRSWGVRPAAVLGHSLGEYAAACAAGVLPARTAALLVAERGRLMSALPGDGAMASVFADAASVHAAVAGLAGPGPLCVAAYNGPRETVVSGTAEAVDALLARLTADGVRTRRLEVSHAFHSPLMDPAVEAFAPRLADAELRPARLPFYSPVTGGRLDAAAPAEAGHWLRNLREPVRFDQAVRALAQDGCDVFVEVGPQPVLTGLARRGGLAADEDRWLASMARSGEETTRMLQVLGRLYARGADVAWEALEERRARPRKVVLPTYPFQRRRHWRDTRGTRRAAPGGRAVRSGTLLGARLVSPAVRDTVFHRRYDTSSPAHLPDHLLYGTVVVPGASHLALLLDAARAEYGPGAYRAHEVLFPRALALAEGQAREVQIVLAAPGADADGRSFQVVSAPADEERPVWTSHATGVLESAAGADADAAAWEPSAAVRARCEQLTSGEELHGRMDRAGYGLGPSFRWIRRIHHRAGEALAELSRPEAAGSGHVLHPGLLDTCFQAAMVLVPEDRLGEDGLHVPVRVDRLVCHGALEGEGPLWLHLRRQPVREDGDDGDDLVVDLTLADERERPVLEMTGVRLRRVERAALTGTGGEAVLRTVRWREAPALPAAAATAPAAGRWLVVGEDAAAGADLAGALREAGAAVRALADGVDLGRPEEVARAVADAADGPLDGVVGLWTGAGGGTPPAAGALHLVQAVAQAAGAPRLWLVTRGAQCTDPAQGADAELAAVWGLGRVAAAELPAAAVSLVDLDPAGGSGPAELRLLAAELTAGDRAPRAVAHRAGRRLVARAEDLPPAGARPPRLRADALYLVTGGTGGLGLHVARQLAERGARHLALLARGPLGARAEAEVAALRAAGVTVRLPRADVGDLDALRAALAALRADGPPLRGVVHAAGVLDDGILLRQDAGRLREVAAPKTDGARLLRAALAGTDLDFLLLFSSAAATHGTLGQGGYAAANAALDALAHAWRREGLPVTSVAWGAWAGTGMTAHLSRQDLDRLAEQGVGALAPGEAAELLDRVLAEPVPAHVLALRTAPAAARPAVDRGSWHPRPESLGAYAAPASGDEKALAELWEEAFRIRPIGVEDDFFALGGDSMLALTITTRARRRGLAVKESDFFRSPTVRGLLSAGRDGAEAVPAADRDPRGGPDAATPALSEESRALLRGRLSGGPRTQRARPVSPLLAARLRAAAGGGERSRTTTTSESGEAQS
ncbi:type I polyketide synthase [Streptomyces mexicanus]|uniref:type I polyketide synthase n=1 Tax=Streptomyces mexicanus TaxID=178566 RepID=UPI00368E74EA